MKDSSGVVVMLAEVDGVEVRVAERVDDAVLVAKLDNETLDAIVKVARRVLRPVARAEVEAPGDCEADSDTRLLAVTDGECDNESMPEAVAKTLEE